MRAYRRMNPRRRGGGENSFWLSFSDLMSSLLLIVILVMFYIIYQYFNMVEINARETARREQELSAAQTELETQQAALTTAQARLDELDTQLAERETELTTAQSQLADRESELTTAQSQLAERETELATAQTQLETQQSALSAAQEQLATQQAALTTAQEQLATQQAALEAQQAQIEQLVGVRPRIIRSLSDALRDSNVSASVDTATGSITLASDVLFATGEYELSANGRAFIDRFLPVYLEVLFSDEYRPYVSEIIIEGHTDSVGDYLSNLELSQQRALAVASYVLGDSRAVSTDVKRQLSQVVTVNGRSFSDPILDSYGHEDMDASRRVVFKFRLTDEQMIQQLQTILED